MLVSIGPKSDGDKFCGQMSHHSNLGVIGKFGFGEDIMSDTRFRI